MPLDANCPQCQHTFPVTEARHPFTVSCPKCDGDLTVEFRKPSVQPEPGEPHYELLVKPGALPGTGGPPPAPKRKSDDDEDVRGGGSMMVVLLSGGLGLLFVMLGLGVTGWYLFTQVDMSSGYANRNNNFNNNNRPPNNNNNNNRPNPQPWQPDPWQPQPKKVIDTFDLRPVNGRLDRITPPVGLQVNDPKTILLDGTVETVSVGGGGRYIVLAFPAAGRLQVFDASTGEITNSVNVPSEYGRQIAAGANKVAVKTNQSKRYRVYSLPNLQQEGEFELSGVFDAVGIAMGSRTNGPLLAIDPFGEAQLVDLSTNTVIEGSKAKVDAPRNRLSATADGKLFFGGDSYNDRDRFKMIDEFDKRWRVRDPNATAAYIAPNGQRIYAKDQILSSTGSQLAGKPTGVNESVWYVPAVTSTGDYFMSVYERRRQGATPETVVLTLLRGTNVNAPVLTAWSGLEETKGLASAFFNATDPLDKHLFLIPEAKLLVILNKNRTQLVVRKLNI
jgi:hypothetical protein